MRRYIDVDLYIEYLTELKQSAEKHYKLEEAASLGQEINRIKVFPPARNVQEVRHGKWEGYIISAYIGGEDEYGDPRYANRRFYRCSKCYYGSVIKSNFCPNCGAKMDKE